MRTVLYYFTGTGNSLMVAKELAVKLGTTELIPIARTLNEKAVMPKAQCIGIIFPVYMWGLPLIVAEFVKKLDVVPTTYIFGVATYGGFPAGTFLQMQKLLNKKGLSLSAGFGVTMPRNYIPLYNMMTAESQQKLFAQAQIKITTIAKTVQEQQRTKIPHNGLIIDLLFSSFLYRMSSPYIHKMDSKFWADAKCDGCGICAKVCPVKNITMENGKPHWRHYCEQCLACLQWCPKEAIQYGQATQKRKRYHHPSISLVDVTGQKTA
jgi:ferredoxin